MNRRSQSDVIGVVLLTAVITVTVTGAGGVVLTDWQSDITGEPVADIESGLSFDSISLEHFGGDRLNASETVVLVNGTDMVVPLSAFDGVGEQFVGGMEIENDEFDFEPGEYSLDVVHKPSGTVLHSETYGIEFILLIADDGGPVFMIKEPPISYTTSPGTELTVSDGSVIDLDRDEQTITGVQTGETTAITATKEDRTQTIDLTVVERNPLAIETVDADGRGPETIELTGELTEIGALDETDLYGRYRKQQPVEFNGDPTNNSDDVIADGQYHTDPAGYSHAREGYVHYNTPLVPGTNRTYEFVSGNSLNDMEMTFRDREWTEVGTFNPAVDAIEELPGSYNQYDIREDISKTEFEIRVEYTDDGSTVRVYLDDTQIGSYSGLDDYHELYFSTYLTIETNTNPENSIRAITVPGFGAPESELIEADVDSPSDHTGGIADLDPDSFYAVAAYGQETVGGRRIIENGSAIAFRTDSIVETGGQTDVTAESARLHGELTESLGDTDLSVVVTRTDTGSVVAEETAETGVDTPRTFNATVSGLSPDTNYTYYARAEDTDSTGQPVTDTGANMSFTTDTPVVRTLDTESTGSSTVNVTGRLVDLGGLDQTGLYVRYWKQQPVEFNGDPTDNGDDVISDGQYHNTTPEGYSFGDEGYLHDNTPLVPGTNRTYKFVSKSRSNELHLTFRDREWTEVGTFDPDQDAIEVPSYDNTFEIKERPLEDTWFEVRIEYTADGSTVRMYVNDTQVDSYSGFDEHHRLYVSSGQGSAWFVDPEDRLRATSIPGLGAPQSEFVTTTDSVPTDYTAELTGLDADSVYFAEAYSSVEIDDQYVNATGKELAGTTEP